jgi:hypothetical protein
MGSIDEMLFRRRIAYGKIAEGWDKLAHEHPGINWQLDTRETQRAEEAVVAAKERYEREGGGLKELREAFAAWREAHIKKGMQPELFAVPSVRVEMD